jgi:hypothetical protein
MGEPALPATLTLSDNATDLGMKPIKVNSPIINIGALPVELVSCVQLLDNSVNDLLVGHDTLAKNC